MRTSKFPPSNNLRKKMIIKKDKIQYLGLIQGAVNRLAGNSFLIKGWTITVSLAIFGFTLHDPNKSTIFWMTSFSILIFWTLDSYYLKQEKLFRKLYEDVAKINFKGSGFSMDTSLYEKDFPSIFCIMLSFPTNFIYIAIFIMNYFLYFLR